MFGVGLQSHGRHDIAIVWVLVQHVVHRVFHLLLRGGQGDELFRPTVDLAPLKIHDAAAQGAIRGILFVRVHRGLHIQAACIGLVTILVEHELAHHLGHVFSVHLVDIRAALDL